MFSILKLDTNYPIGTCVKHNGTSDNVWTKGGGDVFGVVESGCEPDPDGVHFWARIRLAGEVLAIADSSISQQGGKLAVNDSNGRVYIATTDLETCGIICPNSRYQDNVNEGDLVTVFIR